MSKAIFNFDLGNEILRLSSVAVMVLLCLVWAPSLHADEWDRKSFHPYHASQTGRAWRDIVQEHPERLRALADCYADDMCPANWAPDEWRTVRVLLQLQIANPEDLELQRVSLLTAKRAALDHGATHPLLATIENLYRAKLEDWHKTDAAELEKAFDSICRKYGLQWAISPEVQPSGLPNCPTR